MATGYTSDLSEKDDITFNEFLWRCARAFGPFIHMRDDSSKDPPRFPKKDSYYVDCLERANKTLNELLEMTSEQVQQKLDDDYQRSRKSALESIESRNRKLIRYQKMLAQVEAWTPPTDEHIELKNFMSKQIKNSIEFDCDLEYMTKELVDPKETPEEYLKNRIEWVKDDIERYTKSVAEEEENQKFAVKWIKDLAESVPPPRPIDE